MSSHRCDRCNKCMHISMQMIVCIIHYVPILLAALKLSALNKTRDEESSSPWTLDMQTTCLLLNPDFFAKSCNILSDHSMHWSSTCLTIRRRMLWLLPSWEAEESCASPGLTFMRSLSADLDRGWGWPQSGHEFILSFFSYSPSRDACCQVNDKHFFE